MRFRILALTLAALIGSPAAYSDEQPPKSESWLAICVVAVCGVQDAPAQHPDPTNRVELAASEPLKIKVQASQDGRNWATVNEQVCDLEDFVYYPTNAAMYRLEVRIR